MGASTSLGIQSVRTLFLFLAYIESFGWLAAQIISALFVTSANWIPCGFSKRKTWIPSVIARAYKLM